jgi:hypothetical protein
VTRDAAADSWRRSEALPVSTRPRSTDARIIFAMRKLSWFLTWFIGLFLFVDGAGRLAGFAPYIEGTTRFGIPGSCSRLRWVRSPGSDCICASRACARSFHR